MTLDTWVNKAIALANRRSRYGNSKVAVSIARRWLRLQPDAMYRCSDLATLDWCEHLINSLRLKPSRGQRGGTRWKAINVALNNRRQQLVRLHDSASIASGDNYVKGALK